VLAAALLLVAADQAVAIENGVNEPSLSANDADNWQPDIERFQREVVDTLERADAVTMSLLVNFPLRVNLPDGTAILIANETTLQARFDQVFPKAFRAYVVATSKAGTGEDGWAGNGYMIAHGALWAQRFGGDIGARFRIETVNAQMPGNTKRGQTLLTCETARHRIVVDSVQGATRYRAWNKPHFPPDAPDMTMLDGTAGSGGTGPCFARSWSFKKGDAAITVSESRCTAGTDSPPEDTRATIDLSSGDKRQLLYCF